MESAQHPFSVGGRHVAPGARFRETLAKCVTDPNCGGIVGASVTGKLLSFDTGVFTYSQVAMLPGPGSLPWPAPPRGPGLPQGVGPSPPFPGFMATRMPADVR